MTKKVFKPIVKDGLTLANFFLKIKIIVRDGVALTTYFLLNKYHS